MLPFTPQLGQTVSITADATGVTAAIAMFRAESLLVTNTGDNLVYISFGNSAPTPAVDDMPILGRSAVVVSVPPTIEHVGAITDSGTSVVKFTAGSGF